MCFYCLRSKEKIFLSYKSTGIPVSRSNRANSGLFSRKIIIKVVQRMLGRVENQSWIQQSQRCTQNYPLP